jgi:rod shape-determining protein MreD
MIMPRGEQLLLPASPWFIALSILCALLLNLLPTGSWVGMPDMLLLVLAFWGVHQPRRVGLVWAFVLGLSMDVQHTALLGQHALAYVLVMYVAQHNSRRLLWFSGWYQAVQMLPLFVMAHGLQLLTRLVAGDMFPSLWLALAPLLEGLLWPLAVALLLAPQRRAPVSDDERPL